MTKGSANKHRLAQARAASEKVLFMLHCDGINVGGKPEKKCTARIFVPMSSMRSLEEINLTLKSVDWRVSFAKVPVEDSKLKDAAFAQCTDCWIEFYKMMVENREDKEEVLAQIDPEGKFLDRLRGSVEDREVDIEHGDSESEAEK